MITQLLLSFAGLPQPHSILEAWREILIASLGVPLGVAVCWLLYLDLRRFEDNDEGNSDTSGEGGGRDSRDRGADHRHKSDAP